MFESSMSLPLTAPSADALLNALAETALLGTIGNLVCLAAYGVFATYLSLIHI